MEFIDERSIANTKQLTVEFGTRFSARNIRNMRQFYNCVPILQTVSAKSAIIKSQIEFNDNLINESFSKI